MTKLDYNKRPDLFDGYDCQPEPPETDPTYDDRTTPEYLKVLLKNAAEAKAKAAAAANKVAAQSVKKD